jgi:LysR family glycine cleavage system transcriptional activator
LFPVVRPDYRGGDWPRSQADLAKHALIHHPESGWRLWLDPAETDPTSLARALYLEDQVLVIEATAAGHGIGLVREQLVADDLRSGRLVRILDRSVPAEYSYWAVWSGSTPKLPLINAFVDAVEAAFESEPISTGQ